MLFSAVCSARAMMARTASWPFGRGDSWWEEEEPREALREWDGGWPGEGWSEEGGGLPRDVGGAVGKVW